MAQAQVHDAKMSVGQFAELRAQVINDHAAVVRGQKSCLSFAKGACWLRASPNQRGAL